MSLENTKLTLHESGCRILKKSDKDLGLAVIERWTHAFLGSYHDQANDQMTLEEVMVSPFTNKQVLGAQIGAKDDTSSRKFNDITLSEFFGPKGVARGSSNGPRDAHPPASQQPETWKIETRSVESRAESLPCNLNHVRKGK